MSTFRSTVSITLLWYYEKTFQIDASACVWMEVYLNFPLNEQTNRFIIIFNRFWKGVFDPILNNNYRLEEVCSVF